MKFKTSNGLILNITLSQARAVVNAGKGMRKEVVWLSRHPNVRRTLNACGPLKIREAIACYDEIADHENHDDMENRYLLVARACEMIVATDKLKAKARDKKYRYKPLLLNSL
jgi:hypothetical protein